MSRLAVALLSELNLLVTAFLALLFLFISFASILEFPFFPLSPNSHYSSTSSGTNSSSAVVPLLENGNSSQLPSASNKGTGRRHSSPSNSFFSLFLLWTLALVAGRLCHYARLPPLFGMLLVGLLFANLPPLAALLQIAPSWDILLRKTAFVLILLRCGLGLNPRALKESMVSCVSLGILSTSAEILVILLISFLLFQIPFPVAVLFGFVLASTSPAVTVPTMIQLQNNQRGTRKGIPTMVLASASIDNIFCISGFAIAFDIASTPSGQLSHTLAILPIQLFAALIFGGFIGIVLRLFPQADSPSAHFSRTLLLCASAMAFYFGSATVHLQVAGPIAVIISCFLAAVKWRTDNPKETLVEAEALRRIWELLLLPLLFVLIGLRFDLSMFSWASAGRALLVTAAGLLVRVLAVLGLARLDRRLAARERLFVSVVFLPKATVQAALAPLLAQFALSAGDPLGAQFVLQTCILSILLTAPTGQLLIQLLANSFLSDDSKLIANYRPKSSNMTISPVNTGRANEKPI